jgi:2-amino-4,5-dihydroxy-6-oxo-7-(phosphonooxy)heptanoate synthase
MVPMSNAFARQVRLRRLDRHGDQRLLVVPLDHSISDGPIVSGGRLDHLIGQLVRGGVDAVVLHKGSLRQIDPRRFATLSLIVHLSASTAHAADPDAKYLVASVEEALRLGADAVSVHVNVGSRDEQRQISDLAYVSDACDRWNLPLLAMMYPRGPKVSNPTDPALVAHAATLAADLGADIVKTLYVGSVTEMAEITRDCPVPIIVAGGPRKDSAALLSYVEDSLRGGAAGVAMGRNIFQAADPAAMAGMISERIHGGTVPGRVGSLESLTAAAH